ncbi:MAG: hypothetical protein CMB56_001705 [Methanobacteriota archaeon]|nr:MAG: hypothetical protein CMB56_001705 [Euryarchaeota archaeon]
MSGIEVVEEHLRDLDNLSEKDVEHVRRIYESDTLDIVELLENYIPSSNHLRRLARATQEEINLALELSTGVIAVRDIEIKSRFKEGLFMLCKDRENRKYVVWQERNGNYISSFSEPTEKILSFAECEIGIKGNILPEWFDFIQESALEKLSNELNCNTFDLIPILSIINSFHN